MNTEDLSRLKIDRSATTLAPRRRRLRWWMPLLAVVIGGAAWAGWQLRARPEVQSALVVTAYPSQAATVLNATGYVVAQRKAAVSSKATGRLEWLGVQEGSPVHEGEVIARLESRDVQAAERQAAAQVAVARANLEQAMAEQRDARRVFDRSAALLAKGFISPAVHDADGARLAKAAAGITSLRAAIEAAQANHQAARVALDQTNIRAPFDGVVLTKSANVGDIVTPFSSALDAKGAVVTMADMSTLEVEADVSEASIARIRPEQPCEILLDAFPDLRLAGVVSRMVPTLDRSKATLLVKIRFIDRDPRVLPEMSAKVGFLSRALTGADRQPVTVIPPAALVQRGNDSMVYVLTGDIARLRPVQPAAKAGDLQPVSGVRAGERVVLDPPPGLADGARVRLAGK